MRDSDSTKEAEFHALVRDIKECRKCAGLNIERETESAPGFGNLNADVMVVGQSLCRRCMKTQVPFSGGSGRLLDAALKRAGVEKRDIFVTNAVHCHTPGNRRSLPHELSNCNGYLMREISLVQPRAIIALGRDAALSFLSPEQWPSSVGKKIPKKLYVIYPFYHPSYAMKMGNDRAEDYVRKLARVIRDTSAHSTRCYLTIANLPPSMNLSG